MCVVCGVTLELATSSPQAIQERDFIRQLIAQGLTKDEIKDRLVAEFGSEVLAIFELCSHQGYCISTDSQAPDVQLGRHVYTVTEFA